MYQVVYTKQAAKDINKLKAVGLDKKAKKLVETVKINPFQNPPPYEALKGQLKGFYSRRINIHHRLVYQVIEDLRVVKIIRMWTHYQ